MNKTRTPTWKERLPEMVSLQDTAEILGVHPITIRRWIASGHLHCVRAPSGRILGIPFREIESLFIPQRSADSVPYVPTLSDRQAVEYLKSTGVLG